MKTQTRFFTIFSLALMAVLLASLAGPAGTAPALARDLQPAEKQVLEQEGLFAGSIPTENFEGLNSTDWGQIQELIAASFPPEQAYLKASNTGTGDEFGYSVAIFGDTVVVGAYREDSNASGVNGDGSNNTSADSGAVYVFVRDAGTWSQQAYLKAATNGGVDQFGRAVAINGDTIVVGAHQEASNATGVGGDASNNSASNSGAAYVFVRNGSTWSQQAYLKASNTGAGDRFGSAVAVFGDTIVVGAHLEDSNVTGVGGNGSDNSAADSGAAYVFTRNGTFWSQQAYLKASNTDAGDRFGYSVAIDGETIVVGAYGEGSNATGVGGDESDNSAPGSGAVYVFLRNGSTWSQQAYLKASNTDAGDQFGHSVAISNNTLVVGANRESSNATGINGDEQDNSVFSAGAAYVFLRLGSLWIPQAYLKASNAGEEDQFGYSVAISGHNLVVGALFEESSATGMNGDEADNSALSAGAAYLFTRSGTWTQQAYLKASNTGADDRFGNSVAIFGDTVVVGSPREDSNATGIDGDGSDNSLNDPGAAYAFIAPPSGFGKSAPFNSATEQPLSPTLSWQASTGAVSYEYCIDTSNNDICNTSWISVDDETSASVSGLAGNTTYYWQVRAVNAVGDTEANSNTWWSFKTIATGSEPEAFGKTSPANGATGISLSPTLEWESSTGADSYEYCIDTSNNDTCNTNWISVDDETSVSLSSLAGNTTYYWQIRAVNADGITEANSNTWWSFTTIVTASEPEAFGKASPANGATGISLSPTLEWESSTGADSYEYCIDTSNNDTCNTNWISVDDETSVSLSSLAGNTTYYWQIRAVNADGITEANSNTWWSFTTIVTASQPEAFGKTSPANGATGISLSPTLEWESSTGAGSYEYCLGSTSGTCDLLDWTDVGEDTSIALADLDTETTYYWQVRAVNQGGSTEADDGVWWSFTTVSDAPAAFGKTAPADGASNLPWVLTLTWQSSIGAVSYEYCLDTADNDTCDTSWVSIGNQTSIDLSGLQAGTTYHWQVRAVNTSGTIYANSGNWWLFGTIECGQTFPDVSNEFWACGFIERLANAGITSGFPDGTYRPAQAVTRGQMAVFLLKAMHYPGSYSPPEVDPTFSDTADHWAEDWIEALKASGITGGFPDGTFRPENPVTRAQMAIFLLKAINGPGYEPPPAAPTFSDTAEHWASDWIEALKASGLTGGYPDGTYRPDNPVTRAEMAVFLVKAFGLP